MKQKLSFILYAGDYDLIRGLTQVQKGNLLDAIFCHVRNEEPPDLDPETKMAYHFISRQLERDLEKWEATCEARSRAGKRSAEVRAERKRTNAASVPPCSASPTESVSDSESESVSDFVSESVSETPSAFPPTADAVRAYCKARQNNLDPDAFWDYYTARGWKLGNTPMCDWQAAVRTWERKQPASPSTAAADEPFDEFDAWNIAQLRKEIAQRKADAEDVSAFA